MTTESEKTFRLLYGLMLGTVIGFTVGIVVWNFGREFGRAEMQVEAVKQGTAEYDSASGKWKWKN